MNLTRMLIFVISFVLLGSIVNAEEKKLKFRGAGERGNTGGSIDINVSAKMLEINKFNGAYNDYISQYKRETKIDNLIAKTKSTVKKIVLTSSTISCILTTLS